jgi:hypothetical protein
MPKLPQFQASSQLRTAGAVPRASFTGAVGEAVAGIGRTVAQLAGESIQRQKDADDAAFVTERTNRLFRQETELITDTRTRGVDVDLQELQSGFDGRVDDLAGEAPSQEALEAFRSNATDAFERKFFPSYSKHQAGLNVKRRVQSAETALDDIQSEVLTGRTSISEALGRIESALTGLAETSAGVVDIEAARADARGGVAISSLTARINSGDSENVFKEIQEGNWDQFTTTDQLEALQKQALKAQIEVESQRSAEVSKQNAIIASDLEIGVFRDEVSYRDIDKAMESGVITPAKRTQLTKQLDSNAEMSSKVADNFSRVQTSLQMGIPLDPTSKQDRAGVEQLWQSMQDDLAGRDPNDFTNSAVAFVQSTRILPASLKGNIAAFARSGDFEQAGQAADIIARMQDVDSPALNDLSKESYAFGLSVMDLVRGGVDQQRAVQIARENAFGQTAQDKKVSSLVLKGASPENVTFLNDKLDEFDPGIFSAQPEITPVLQAEFEVLLKEMIPFTGGNIDSARNMAWASMKNVWGATSVNGGIQMMKYSPEAIYGKGGPTDWINKQFVSDITEAGGVPENSVIAVDTKTARSDTPSYPVFTKNEDGVMVPMLDDNNIPLRWKPEFSSSAAYKELQAVQNKKLKAAKFRRNIKEVGARWRQEQLERSFELDREWFNAVN